ncbi:hypothetical protein [Roseateles sp. L2-2]|uniref:hypothetical protein n=1 Tax=Roseateles TaxID=93681 RepID=UPI003D35E6DB
MKPKVYLRRSDSPRMRAADPAPVAERPTPQGRQTRSSGNPKWSFGMKFFREIKFFGFDSAEIDKRWMVSMFYRLGELSGLRVMDVMRDAGVREGTLRIHDIDWSARNAPLGPEDIGKYNDYKVRLSKPLGCEVTALRHEVAQVMAKSRERDCGCESDLAAALQWRRDQRGRAIVMPVIDGTEIEDADQLIAEGRVGSYRDIFAAGLVAVLERRLDS